MCAGVVITLYHVLIWPLRKVSYLKISKQASGRLSPVLLLMRPL